MIFRAKHIGSSIAFCWSIMGQGQVLIDKPILLNGLEPTDRQVTGLSASTAPGSALTAGGERSGALRTFLPNASNAWTMEVPALGSALIPGAHLMVIAPQTTPGPVSVVVNGVGPFDVLVKPGSSLDGNSIETGAALSLVFDGSAFQLMNGGSYGRYDCPAGLVPVNEQFCIETNERASSEFVSAAVSCGEAGLRLCGWGEFIVACNAALTLGLVDISNNWEWTYDSGNENGYVRQVGNGSCSATNVTPIAASHGFRCCYSR